jgi:transketolase
MIELARTADNLMVLTSDVSTSAGLDRFRKTYPDKYLDVGIAEQNMMGIASGLAGEGYSVVTATFAPFQTMRCCEQIRVNLGYMRSKVCMVGLASGIALGVLGNTHCCFEDIGVLRSIPGIAIVSPADCAEVAKALFAAIDYTQPVYIRLTGNARNPVVYSNDYVFEIGKSIKLRDGSDVTIFTNGSMTHYSLAAANILREDGISAAVINMHTVKPLDDAAVKEAALKAPMVTVEEHSIIGGLGSAVAERKTTLKNAYPQLTLGLPDSYGKAGDYAYLLEKYSLTGEKIAEKIKVFLRDA